MTALRFGEEPWVGAFNTYEDDPFTEGCEEGETVGCWPSWGELHDLGSPSKFRWSCRCQDCGARLTASSEDRLRARMKEHA